MTSQNREHNVYNYNQVWQTSNITGDFYLAASGSSAALWSIIIHLPGFTELILISSAFMSTFTISQQSAYLNCVVSQISCGEQIESTESVLELEQFEDCIIHL